MRLRTMWACQSEDPSPELLVAWDETTVSNDPVGFARACQAGRCEVGYEIEACRIVDLLVDDEALVVALAPPATVVALVRVDETRP